MATLIDIRNRVIDAQKAVSEAVNALHVERASIIEASVFNGATQAQLFRLADLHDNVAGAFDQLASAYADAAKFGDAVS